MNEKWQYRARKEWPRYLKEELLNILGLVGRERDIYIERIIEQLSIEEVCMTVNVSESTYRRDMRCIEKKILRAERDGKIEII